MERVRGIGPPSEAWEAPALPLSYTRNGLLIKKGSAACKKICLFLRRLNNLPEIFQFQTSIAHENTIHIRCLQDFPGIECRY